MSDLMKKFELKNLDSYEREKLETTKTQLRRVADMIDLAIQMLDHCEKKDIAITNRPTLNDLRQPDGLAGPESDISKLEAKLEKTQMTVLKKMTKEEVEEMRKDLGVNFISQEEVQEKTINPEQTKGYNG